jgi:glycosyltransferase involved in cell wall biosynthesis
MGRPTLHLLGLPHTVTRPEWSQCAITGKVLRFSPMMRAQGYDVIHYGVEGAESGATLQVDVMPAAQQAELLGVHRSEPRQGPPDMAHDDPAKIALFTTFNRLLRPLLLKHSAPGDIWCLTYGPGHHDAIAPGIPPGVVPVETGVGYNEPYLPCFRIFESYAWMHFHYGAGFERHHRHPEYDYNWVIPNYYDLADWPVRKRGRGDYVLYFGHMHPSKGQDIVKVLADQRPDLRFLLCGRGDASAWAGANVEYVPPVVGRERAALLAGASAVMMPSRFVESFCSAGVEAQLVGTPLLASSWGAFTETIEHGVSGFRCQTRADWLAAIDAAPRLNRKRIAQRARALYSLEAIGPQYARVFDQVVEAGTDPREIAFRRRIWELAQLRD